MDKPIASCDESPPLDGVATYQSEDAGSGQYERVELDTQRFGIFSAIGLQFSCSAAPLAICTFSYLVAGVGGPSYFFWCYLVAVSGQCIVAASLAEIAAILPHASGQVYWAGALSPPKYARFTSYIIGALTFYGWMLGVADTIVFTGDFLVALGATITPTYVPKEYQIFLTGAGSLIVGIILNTVAIKLLPKLNKAMVVILNSSAFYIFVVLLAKKHPKLSAHDAFLKVINETGYSSDGLVFLLGFLPGVLTACLPDASAHIAEEVPQPERIVPLVMFFTTLLNACAGLIMNIVLVFCTPTSDPNAYTEPIGGLPILQLCYDAWANHGWVISVCIILTVVNFNAVPALLTGCSRLLWAFAKTGGMPGGHILGSTNTRLRVPLMAILFTSALAILLSLLVFGPPTVLNGIFGSSTVCMAISYWVPIFFMFINDRNSLPQKRHFNLGRAGRWINLAALCYLPLIIVMLCFPQSHPVTTNTMNWASAVFAGLFAIALVNWFFVRGRYEVPRPLYCESLHGPQHNLDP